MVKTVFEIWDEIALILSIPSVHKYDITLEISYEFTPKFWQFGGFRKIGNLIENFTLSRQNVPSWSTKWCMTQRSEILRCWASGLQKFPVVTERLCTYLRGRDKPTKWQTHRHANLLCRCSVFYRMAASKEINKLIFNQTDRAKALAYYPVMFVSRK